MQNILKNSRFWILLILGIFLLSSLSVYLLQHIQQDSCIAGIYQNGQLIQEIDLARETGRTFIVESPTGGSNTIRVEHGRICMLDATCPDHLCVKQGWIDTGVYPIVCLPNKLTIQLENSSTDAGAPDIMTQ